MDLNATLIGQSVAFAVFVIFCMKYIWPPLISAIEARQATIADGLASAERATKDLELARNSAADQMKEAKAQAASIVDAANKRKAQIVDEAKTAAITERDNIIASGYAEVEAERNRAKEDLRQQVAVLAIAGAEKILERTIDQAAANDIVEKLVGEL